MKSENWWTLRGAERPKRLSKEKGNSGERKDAADQ
jgi:hypothetical protein